MEILLCSPAKVFPKALVINKGVSPGNFAADTCYIVPQFHQPLGQSPETEEWKQIPPNSLWVWVMLYFNPVHHLPAVAYFSGAPGSCFRYCPEILAGVHDRDRPSVAAPSCPAPEGCVYDFNENRPMGPVMSDLGGFWCWFLFCCCF